MPDNYMYLGLLAALFPERHVHPLPPRPARRGRLVLDDRLPQHPLGQRPRAHRLAVPAVPPADGPLAKRCCRCRSTRSITRRRSTDLEAVARRLMAACGLEWEPACLEFHRTRAARPHRQRHAGPPAGLPAIGRPLEELRAGTGRAVRGPACRRAVTFFSGCCGDTPLFPRCRTRSCNDGGIVSVKTSSLTRARLRWFAEVSLERPRSDLPVLGERPPKTCQDSDEPRSRSRVHLQRLAHE